MQICRFRELLHPLTPEEFFGATYGQSARHVPGPENKFAEVFSWEEFNRLLNMSRLWSSNTMKMVLDGRDVAAGEFCEPGQSREGQGVLRPDVERVSQLLGKGATVVLDLVESLAPGIARVAGSLQLVMGAAVSCNVYCSWQKHQGFLSHFDTMDVFALQVHGCKTWRLYEGRFRDPVDLPGFEFTSLPTAHHNRAKGNLLATVLMEPGDLLYVPRGQYHEALAESEASLHLSFGVTEPTGHDFLSALLRSLPEDPLFRENMPHFDDQAGHGDHIRRLADRLHAIMVDPATSTRMRGQQQERAERDSIERFALPAREPVARYRVRWRAAEFRKAIAELASGADAEIARWIAERDHFSRGEIEAAFSARNGLDEALERLAARGLIERL